MKPSKYLVLIALLFSTNGHASEYSKFEILQELPTDAENLNGLHVQIFTGESDVLCNDSSVIKEIQNTGARIQAEFALLSDVRYPEYDGDCFTAKVIYYRFRNIVDDKIEDQKKTKAKRKELIAVSIISSVFVLGILILAKLSLDASSGGYAH